MKEGDQIRTQKGYAKVLSVDGQSIRAKYVETGEEFDIALPQAADKMLPKARITFEQGVAAFLARFPQGFYDPEYIGDMKKGERHYKWVAHEFYEECLGHGRFRQLLASKPSNLVTEVERCISKVNLLYPMEAAALRDALRVDEAAVPFLTRLAELLEAETITEQVYTPYAKAVCDLPAERGPVAKWTVATIIPFLAQPSRHMFLKPKITQSAAAALGFQLNYRAQPNWLTYKCLLQMSETYKSEMLKKDLPALTPRDYIDVQSFFWVVGGGYDVQ